MRRSQSAFSGANLMKYQTNLFENINDNDFNEPSMNFNETMASWAKVSKAI